MGERDRDLSDEASLPAIPLPNVPLTDRFWLWQDEQSRLLFDDPCVNHYGSFGDHSTGIIQADPQEVQRETEALQKVVTQTSK